MEYTLTTLKKLFALSGNQCAFPKCEAPIVDFATGIVVGEICHIKGKSPNGPRYDRAQLDRERNGYENLLLMCNPHNKVVDHETNLHKYTVEVLKGYKSDHESKFRRSLIRIDDWSNDGAPIDEYYPDYWVEDDGHDGLDPDDPGAVHDLIRYVKSLGTPISRSQAKDMLERLASTTRLLEKLSDKKPEAS
jgi:hypothetical protein